MTEAAQLKETPSLFKEEYGNLINGQWVSSASGETIDMINPATGEHLSKIQSSNGDDVERAVAAASAALPAWAQSSASERQDIIYEIAQRMKRGIEKYAMMETLDNGKPLRESMHFDMPNAIGQFELFAGAAFHLHGQTMDYADAIGIIHREPIGVVAQIIPWNVPILMMASKIAPALAAGCTVVLKPAENVCLSIMEFFQEMNDIIPPGVVNVVTGYGPNVGEALVTHQKSGKLHLQDPFQQREKSCNMHPQISFPKLWNWAGNQHISFVRMRTLTQLLKPLQCRQY